MGARKGAKGEKIERRVDPKIIKLLEQEAKGDRWDGYGEALAAIQEPGDSGWDGGNYEHAFQSGMDTGRTELARQLLAMLKGKS